MHLPTLLTRLAAASALTLAALGARAETYDFTLTGGGQSQSWQLASAPTPDYVGSSSFAVYNVVLSSFGSVMLEFFKGTGTGGGLDIDFRDGTFISYFGPQLFSGNVSTPTFDLGSFTLSDENGAESTLTISAATVAAVPEPATVALMLAGLGLVGGIASRRHKVGRPDTAATSAGHRG